MKSGILICQDLSDARRQDLGLSCARAGNHQHRPFNMAHSLQLSLVQRLQRLSEGNIILVRMVPVRLFCHYAKIANIQGHPTRKRINPRSEEHTSELQSLMRISYAVFCLKKKKNN